MKIYHSALSLILTSILALYAIKMTAILPLLLLLLHHVSIPSAEDLKAHGVKKLVLVQVCSPFYAVCIGVLSVVAALFCCFDFVVDDSCSDGRAVVMAVKAWWQRWLSRALVQDGDARQEGGIPREGLKDFPPAAPGD